jgi:hypothetical protein
MVIITEVARLLDIERQRTLSRTFCAFAYLDRLVVQSSWSINFVLYLKMWKLPKVIKFKKTLVTQEFYSFAVQKNIKH